MKISVITLIASLLLMVTNLNAQTTVTANKKYETKTISLDSFSGLTLNGSHDVFYTQSSGKPSAEIYASGNLIPLIEVFVQNGTLIIQYKKNTRINNSGKVEIRVSGPALSDIKVNGSGDIELVNGINTNKDLRIDVHGSGDISGKKISCNNLEIKVHGSGDISGKDIKCNNIDVNVHGSGDIALGEITAKTCEARVNGSGDIKLNGTTEEARYNVHGSGELKAEEFKAEYVSAYVTGSGDIACHAVKKLTGKVSGSGEVHYRGNPEIDFSKKGLHKL